MKVPLFTSIDSLESKIIPQYIKESVENKKEIASHTRSIIKRTLFDLIEYVKKSDNVEVTRELIAQHIEGLKFQGYSDTSIKQKVSILAKFFKHLSQKHKLTYLMEQVAYVNKGDKAKEQESDYAQLLLDELKMNQSAERRDRALFNMIIKLGLSTAQICDLQLKDVIQEKDTLNVFSKNIYGSGKLSISLPRDENTEEFFLLIENYIKKRKSEKINSSYFFVSNTGTQLSRFSIKQYFKKYCKKLNLLNISTRDLRSTRHHLLTEPDKSENIRLPDDFTLRKKELNYIKEISLGSLKDESNPVCCLVVKGGEGYGKSDLLAKSSIYFKENEFCVYEEKEKPTDDRHFFESMLNNLTDKKFSQEELKNKLIASVEQLGEEKRTALFILYEELSQYIIDCAKKKASIVVIDDLHLFSRVSVEFLNYLVMSIYISNRTNEKKIPLFFLVSILDSAQYDNNDTTFMGEFVGKEKPYIEVQLQKPSAQDISEQLKSRIPHLSDELRDFIRKTVGGNLYYLNTFIDILTKNKELAGISKTPQSLDKFITYNFKNLNRLDMEILQIIAVFGNNIEFELILEYLKEKNDRYEIVRSLQNLVESNLLKRKNETYFFQNPIYQKMIYFNLNQNEKSRMHEKIANILQLKYTVADSNYLYIADHLLYSGNTEKALPFLMQSALLYQQKMYFDSARNYYLKALDILEEDQKIDVFLELANIELFFGNFEKQIFYLGKFIILQSDNEKKATALMNIGTAHIKLGDFTKAIEYLELGYKLTSSENKAKFLIKLAQSQNLLGDYQSALDILNKREKELVELKTLDPDYMYELAISYYYKMEYKSANNLLKSAIALVTPSDKSVNLTKLFNALGMVSYSLGLLDEAIEHYQRALTLAKKHKKISQEATILKNLGLIYDRKGQITEAIGNYSTCIKLAQRVNNQLESGYAAFNLGTIYLRLGVFSEATANAEYSLEIALKLKNDKLMAHSNHIKGEILLAMNEPKKAIEYFENAIRIYEKYSLHDYLADSLLGISNCYIESKEEENAISLINKSEKLGISNMEYSYFLNLVKAKYNLVVKQDPKKVTLYINRAKSFGKSLAFAENNWLLFYIRSCNKVLENNPKEAERLRKISTDLINELSTNLPKRFRQYFKNKCLSIVNKDTTIKRNVDLSTIREITEATSSIKCKEDLRAIFDKIIKLFDLNEIFVANEGEKLKTLSIGRNQIGEDITRVIVSSAPIDNENRDNNCIYQKPFISINKKSYIETASSIKRLRDGSMLYIFATRDEIRGHFMLQEKNLLDIIFIVILTQFETSSLSSKSEIYRNRFFFESNKSIADKRQGLFRHNFDSIIGESETLINVLKIIDRICESDIPIFISGETGTGKELIARAIHENSPRKNNNFITESCANIPLTLFESEFFGFSKGSFSGAMIDKKGLFEIADKGTLFLDEIGELTCDVQSKFLRVLEEGEIRRIGSNYSTKVSVRLISATNRNLSSMINKGEFRSDLFYRINVIEIKLPSLKERKTDIPLLIEYFLNKYNMENLRFNENAMNMLVEYQWPGNIRELENFILKVASLKQDDFITEKSINIDKELAYVY